MANAVTWKNIGTVSGAGALAAANSSRQDIGQGIANIGKAASGFGDDQIQAETDLAVNALRAAAPDDRQGLLQSFADSNISMHSDQIGKVASEIDARDFAEDKFRTTTDATGAQRNIQNELDLSKFEYKKEQDAFSKALSVKKYNQKANEFNRSYDVANGLSRPMPMWDGSTSVNPIEQAQIDNVAINQTKSNPQFEGDTKDLDSSGPILVSRKDATVLAIQDLKLNGSTGGFKSNRDEVESKSGDILISSAVDAFSPVIEKSINDFMATNLEFFDEDGKIDYSAFQDQDQKIAPGAVKAGKMLDGRLSTMTKQMNKYLRNFPAGPKRDAREKQFREESGLNKLTA